MAMKKPQRTRRDVHAQRRRAAFRRAQQDARIDAMLISRPADVAYLCGFTGEDSYLLLGKAWGVLLTDGRFTEQAEAECAGLEIHTRTGPMSRAVSDGLKGRRVRRLGLQAGHATLSLQTALREALGSRTFRSLSGVVSPLRCVKDAGEIRAIRKAVRIAERAFQELTAGGAKRFVGRTERQVAAELEYRMRSLGAEGAAFDTIVATGPNGSLPHYRPGDRKIRRGEPVLIDWGARADGYCSDLTRVVFPGRIPPKIAALYDVVLSAQRAGIAAIRRGVRGRRVDAAARQVIEAAGWGERFVHGLGHGLGRDVHESPGLSRLAKTPLKAGMIVTVEPGIYLPGVGGVRIEDDVLVTATGALRLGSLSRRMRDMVLR